MKPSMIAFLVAYTIAGAICAATAESHLTIPVLQDGSLQLAEGDRQASPKFEVIVLSLPRNCPVSSLTKALDAEASEIGIPKVILESGGRRAPYRLPCNDGYVFAPWYHLAWLLRNEKQKSDIQFDPSLPDAVQMTVHVTKAGFKSDQAEDLISIRKKLESLKSKYKVVGIQIQADPEADTEQLMDLFLMAKSIQMESYFLTR